MKTSRPTSRDLAKGTSLSETTVNRVLVQASVETMIRAAPLGPEVGAPRVHLPLDTRMTGNP